MTKKYVIECYDEKSMRKLEQSEKHMDKKITQLKALNNLGLEYLNQTEKRMQKYTNVNCYFEMYVNDKASKVLSTLEERVKKLTQNPYQIEFAASTETAMEAIQGLETRLNQLMTKWSLDIQLRLPSLNHGGMQSAYQQPQSLKEKFQEDPLGTVYGGLTEFANVVNIFDAFKKLKDFGLKDILEKGDGKLKNQATMKFPNIAEKSTQLLGKSKLLTKGIERMATTRIGQAASTTIGNIPTLVEAGTLSTGLGLAATGGAMLTAYGVVDGASTLYNGLTSKNNYDKIHDTVNGGFSLAGTGTGALIGSLILPGAGTLIGGGIGYLAGKISGMFADDKIADKYAFDEKETSKYADDGRLPLASGMLGNAIAAPAALAGEIGAAAAGLKSSSESLLALSNQNSFNAGAGITPIYGGNYEPSYPALNAPMDIEIFGQKSIRNQIQVTPEDFGIPKSLWVKVDAQIYGNKNFSDSRRGWINHPRTAYRGGIVAPAFAEGGYVHGGAQLITVAEEGTPEAIIPLGRHRRKRALQLFNQVGGYLQAPGFSPKGFAAGGIVGGSIGSIGSAGGSGAPVAIEVGGVEIRVEAKDGQSLVETIRENKEAISEEIAGVFNAAFRGQFANTPAAGGAGL